MPEVGQYHLQISPEHTSWIREPELGPYFNSSWKYHAMLWLQTQYISEDFRHMSENGHSCTTCAWPDYFIQLTPELPSQALVISNSVYTHYFWLCCAWLHVALGIYLIDWLIGSPNILIDWGSSKYTFKSSLHQYSDVPGSVCSEKKIVQLIMSQLKTRVLCYYRIRRNKRPSLISTPPPPPIFFFF